MQKDQYNPSLEQHLVLEKQTDSAQPFECCNSQQDAMALQPESTSSRQLATIHPASERKGNSTQPKTFFQKAFVCALFTGGVSISSLFFPLLCRKALAAPVCVSILSASNKVECSLSSGTRVLYHNRNALRCESQVRFTPQLKTHKLPCAKSFVSNPHSRLREAYTNPFVIGNPSRNKGKPRRGYRVKRFLLAGASCASKNPKNLPHLKSFGLDSHSVLSHTNRSKFVSGSPSNSRFHQMHGAKLFAQEDESSLSKNPQPLSKNSQSWSKNPHPTGTPEWIAYTLLRWGNPLNFISLTGGLRLGPFCHLEGAIKSNMDNDLIKTQILEGGSNIKKNETDIAKTFADEGRAQNAERRAEEAERRAEEAERRAQENHKLDVDAKKANIAKIFADERRAEEAERRAEEAERRAEEAERRAEEAHKLDMKIKEEANKLDMKIKEAHLKQLESKGLEKDCED